MKRDKYMGLDVHQAMTVAVVIDAEGKVVLETIVATEAAGVLRLVKSLSGPLRVTFEESTQAEWLYELLRSHVTEVVVCDPRRNKLLSERPTRSMRANWRTCFAPGCCVRFITAIRRRGN